MFKKNVYLFDLDETVINSSHRTPYKKNGDLDLDKYRSLQNHENIMKDTLLPLSVKMRHLINTGELVATVTARRMIKSDYIMLRKNKIKSNLILNRNNIHKVEHLSGNVHKHFRMTDGEYKRVWFKFIKELFPLDSHSIFLYDDNKNVLAVANEEGFHAIDAIKENNLILKKINI